MTMMQRGIDEGTGNCQECGELELLAPVGDEGNHVCCACVDKNPDYKRKMFRHLLKQYSTFSGNIAVGEDRLRSLNELSEEGMSAIEILIDDLLLNIQFQRTAADAIADTLETLLEWT
jgi:hypothetical protein